MASFSLEFDGEDAEHCLQTAEQLFALRSYGDVFTVPRQDRVEVWASPPWSERAI